MFITVTESIFIDAFRQSEERKNSFSYDGLKALYEVLQEDNCEFDMVAICCDWRECEDAEEVLNEETHDYDSSDDLVLLAEEWLNMNANQWVKISSGGYLIQY